MGSSRLGGIALAIVSAGCQVHPSPVAPSSVAGNARAAAGLTWPDAQQFPSFAPPVSLDVIAASGRAADTMAMLASLQGVVNRAQPRIYIHDGGSADSLWLSELAVP